MSASDWTMQCVADMIAAPVDRPAVLETTALGAGYLAGWQAGLYPAPGCVRGAVASGAAVLAGDGRGGATGESSRAGGTRSRARCRARDH